MSIARYATGRPSIRNLGGSGSTDAGDARYNFNAYIRERGDANIKSLTDLVEKANFWTDPWLSNRKASLESADRARTLRPGPAPAAGARRSAASRAALNSRW